MNTILKKYLLFSACIAENADVKILQHFPLNAFSFRDHAIYCKDFDDILDSQTACDCHKLLRIQYLLKVSVKLQNIFMDS